MNLVILAIEYKTRKTRFLMLKSCFSCFNVHCLKINL